MIVIKLMGGLGNQMFQYAFGRAVSFYMRKQLFLDISFFNNQLAIDGYTPRIYELSIFNTKAQLATNNILALFSNPNIINSLRKRINMSYYKYYHEIDFLFDNNVFSQKAPIYFSGYWQSEKYFLQIAEDIKRDFEFKLTLDEYTRKIAEEIKNGNSVSVHFRRGDYVSSKITNNYHGVCSLNYYYQALERFDRINKHTTYYIFSDDIEWVKANFLCQRENVVYVHYNVANDGWKDMYLMSLCKHNIIANSSFSWWGAWLNSNPDKIVITPKQWFANNSMNDQTLDLIPTNWLRI